MALPWLPLPLPPALLVWTGPLALAWWLAAIAYVYADAFAVLARPMSELVWSPTRAPLTAAVLTGLALLATAWHTAPQHPRGDEPDYLIIAQSLWLDGELQIENNHARADYTSWHPTVLPPSSLTRGTNGAIYSVHAPGLPALLVPGVALAGYRGAVATMVLLAMVGAWLAWRVSWDVTHDVHASWVAALATAGAAPFFLHGAAIFADAPASVLTLVDLVSALPAAHRDAPAIVVRDVALWTASAAGMWAVWRLLERRGRLDPFVSLMSVAAVVPAASSAVWPAHGVSGLAPATSQIRYLETRATSPSHMLVTITPPPRGRTRAGTVSSPTSARAGRDSVSRSATVVPHACSSIWTPRLRAAPVPSLWPSRSMASS